MRTCRLWLIAAVTGALLVLAGQAWAYLSDVKPLDKTEIAKLTDDQLVDAYLDVIVNIEASRIFHMTSGFAPKEYDDLKSLLKYRYLLLIEINKRDLEVPQIDAAPTRGHPK